MRAPTSVLLAFCWFSWVEPDQAASRPCLLQRSSVSLTTTIASYSLGSQTFPWLQIDQWWITLRCEALFTLNIRVNVFLCSLLSNANVKYEHHYRPQRSWGKVIFSQASVILFTGRGLPQCMLGYHTSPRDQAPPDQAPPGTEHAGRYGQRAGGMHPTGMQSCYLLPQNHSWSLMQRQTQTQSVNKA